MIDIVFPKDNERDFIEMALRLGYKNLCFIYASAKDLENIKKFQEYKINLFSGLLSKPEDVFRIRNKADLILVKSSDKDRFSLEKAKPDILFGLGNKGRDTMHYRSSGLNQVMCRLAKENNVCIGFDFGSLIEATDIKRAVLIGRMKQNTRFCRKYKVKTVIASFADNPYKMRSPHDLVSFGITLGMHPSEAKKSLIGALDKIKTKNLNIN